MSKTTFILLLSVCLCAMSVRALHPQARLLTHRMDRLVEAARESGADLPDVQYYVSLRDHFNRADNTTFRLRYWVNDLHYKEGGPIFLALGQEAPDNAAATLSGTPGNMASKFNAMVITVENRYFGESAVTPDLSTPNIRWLTLEQTLEDYATFHGWFMDTRKLPADTQWIAFGCSYSGAAAAALRLKYPHLFSAAVGGSSPIHAKVDYFEYDQVVASSLKTQSPKCLEVAQQAFEQLSAMIVAKKYDELNSMFDTCQPMQSFGSYGDALLPFAAYNPIAGSVQYNEAPNYPREYLCQVLEQGADNPLQTLVKLQNDPKAMGAPPGECLDIDWLHGPDGLLNVSLGTNYRKWFAMKSQNFGYFKPASPTKANRVLSPQVNMEFFRETVRRVFGDEYERMLDKNIERTNIETGGDQIQATFTIFPHGAEDPWSALTVHTSPNALEAPLVWHGAGHCAYALPAHENDTPSVKQVRADVATFVNFMVTKKPGRIPRPSPSN